MSVHSVIDTVLDRSIVLGYGRPGLYLRRRLPGWPADPAPMGGRVVLITGAGSGIGLAAAAAFTRLGASVRVLGRSQERAEEAASSARQRAGGVASGEVKAVVCDVSSIDALRAFTERFLQEEERLDVLVNNAGVMPEERQHSVDGVELTFATHVLAPWVLTRGLAPLLKRSAPSRVINVVSGGQYGQQLPAGDLESAADSYSPKKIYARTKRAELVLTEQWADRLRDSGVHVHAMHPGWADTKGVQAWMPVFRALSRPVIRTPAEGADTIVWLGSTPDSIRSSGRFWQDRSTRPTTYAAGAGPDDPSTREQLWRYVADLADKR